MKRDNDRRGLLFNRLTPRQAEYLSFTERRSGAR